MLKAVAVALVFFCCAWFAVIAALMMIDDDASRLIGLQSYGLSVEASGMSGPQAMAAVKDLSLLPSKASHGLTEMVESQR